ncbi:hypothetical protein M899_0382 [Bacteriovorax sp. BSW11_IV]|nr:hypothetical protein M899_0382 [Bacteriovorax sp. BSW11_IV]
MSEKKKEERDLDGFMFDALLVTVIIIFPALLFFLTWKFW